MSGWRFWHLWWVQYFWIYCTCNDGRKCFLEIVQMCTKARNCKPKRVLKPWPCFYSTKASALGSSFLHLSELSWFEWCELKMKTSMSFAGATQYPLHDPFPLAATARLNGDEHSWAGACWNRVLESPHLAYICGFRSFDFWLMAYSSSTKAGLFWRLMAFLLHSVLAPVTTAGAAFRRRGLSPARTGDREEMSTAHSMGTPSSYRLCQHLLSRKTVMSRYFDLQRLWCSNNWMDFMESNSCEGLRPSSIALVNSTSLDPSSPVFLQCIAGLTAGFNFRSSSFLDNGQASLELEQIRQISHRVLTHTQTGLSFVAFPVSAMPLEISAYLSVNLRRLHPAVLFLNGIWATCPFSGKQAEPISDFKLFSLCR